MALSALESEEKSPSRQKTLYLDYKHLILCSIFKNTKISIANYHLQTLILILTYQHIYCRCLVLGDIEELANYPIMKN